MCTDGADVRQLEQMIDQVDDHIALEYRWAHRLAHAAGHAEEAAAEKLHRAQSMLGDVRALLDEAKADVGSSQRTAGSATAHLF